MKVKIKQVKDCGNLYTVTIDGNLHGGMPYHVETLKAIQTALNETFKPVSNAVPKQDDTYAIGKDGVELRVGDRVRYVGFGWDWVSTIVEIGGSYIKVADKQAEYDDRRWSCYENFSKVEPEVKPKKKTIRCPFQKGSKVTLPSGRTGTVARVQKCSTRDAWRMIIHTTLNDVLTTDYLSARELKIWYSI